MTYIYNDGGRAAAGHERGKDCVTRSIAIATGKEYQDVFDSLDELSHHERRGKHKRGISNPSTGMYKATIIKYMDSIGWKWTKCAGCPLIQHMICMQTECPKTNVHLCADELPSGRLVVVVHQHYTAMIDGVLHDTYDSSREGRRCVFGYFEKQEGSVNPPAV